MSGTAPFPSALKEMLHFADVFVVAAKKNFAGLESQKIKNIIMVGPNFRFVFIRELKSQFSKHLL